jgi:hypothetical protein
LFVEVDGEEGIVLLKVQRWSLAGAEEVGDVFHLNERHSRLLELDARRWDGEVDELAQHDTISQAFQEVGSWESLAKNVFDPGADLIRGSRCVPVEAQLAQVLV